MCKTKQNSVQHNIYVIFDNKNTHEKFSSVYFSFWIYFM